MDIVAVWLSLVSLSPILLAATSVLRLSLLSLAVRDEFPAEPGYAPEQNQKKVA